MKVALHIYEEKPQGYGIFETSPEAGYLSGHMDGDIMTIDGCTNTLKEIRSVRNNIKTKVEFGGTASYIFITKDGVKILDDECIEDGTRPIVYMSLDEYERIVKLWKQFLETKKEIRTTIEIDDKSILWEQAQENAKKKLQT